MGIYIGVPSGVSSKHSGVSSKHSGVSSKQLSVSHAFHSSIVNPMVKEFKAKVANHICIYLDRIISDFIVKPRREFSLYQL